jgi:hypothetical protein
MPANRQRCRLAGLPLPLGAWQSLALVLSLLLSSLLLPACTDMLHSDAQNASRRSAEARQSALRSMQLSSAQAVAAVPVKGEALVQLLSGNSHVEAFRKRADDARPYLTSYDYFGPDGSFIRRDTHARRTPAYQEVGRWQVKAETLCLAMKHRESEPDCYSLRQAADGTIQYWIHKPGDPFHGLLTRNVKIVRKGLQEPEYTSDPAAFR